MIFNEVKVIEEDNKQWKRFLILHKLVVFIFLLIIIEFNREDINTFQSIQQRIILRFQQSEILINTKARYLLIPKQMSSELQKSSFSSHNAPKHCTEVVKYEQKSDNKLSQSQKKTKVIQEISTIQSRKNVNKDINIKEQKHTAHKWEWKMDDQLEPLVSDNKNQVQTTPYNYSSQSVSQGRYTSYSSNYNNNDYYHYNYNYNYNKKRIPYNYYYQSVSQKRGLRNIGNTCYMNSALQCLLNLSQFNQHLKTLITTIIKPSPSKHTSKPSQPYYKTKQTVSQTKQPHYETKKLSQIYLQILDKIQQKQQVPRQILRELKEQIQTRNNRFYGHRQQDAMEFLTILLSSFNQQLSTVKEIPQYIKLDNDPSKKSIQQLSKEWQDYQNQRDNSIITSKFQGQMISIIICLSCEKKIVSFHKFLSLPITIPTTHSYYQYYLPEQSIEQLIKKDCKAKRKINDFYCNGCGKLSQCQEESGLFKLPQILVVHLKRFTQDYYGTVRKAQTRVKMPFNINLQNSIYATETPSQQKSQTPQQNKSQTTSQHKSPQQYISPKQYKSQTPQQYESQTTQQHIQESVNKKCRYKLNSFINHLGSMHWGHYTANIYNSEENEWYRISDSTVSQTTFEEKSREVYVLFYQKE